MIGVFFGALSRWASPADPSLTLAALFGTTLAPIATSTQSATPGMRKVASASPTSTPL
jgi:hypothetical protein